MKFLLKIIKNFIHTLLVINIINSINYNMPIWKCLEFLCCSCEWKTVFMANRITVPIYYPLGWHYKMRTRAVYRQMVSSFTNEATNLTEFKIIFNCDCFSHHLKILNILLIRLDSLKELTPSNLEDSAEIISYCC